MIDNEVARTMKDLQSVLSECAARFPVAVGIGSASSSAASGGGGGSGRSDGRVLQPEVEKFILNAPSTAPADQVKVVVTMAGDKISHADINLKLPRGGTGSGSGSGSSKDFYQNTSIREDAPWGLQQV